VQVYVFDFRFGNMFFKHFTRFTLFFITLIPISVIAQRKQVFSKYEYLHGKLTPLRTCFDVKQYEITIKVEPAKKFISGSNAITFQVVKDFQKLQLDLFSILKIDSILFNRNKLTFTRDSNATFIDFGTKLKKGALQTIVVYYKGTPPEAKKAPWDGGFVWAKDSSGNDWVGLACEGLGASCWLPCKDHLSDEADSMKMHLIVPSKLTGVSNGRLMEIKDVSKGFTQFDWQVKNRINNYDITINIGNYAHIHDVYTSKFNTLNKELDLDYYVLKQNEQIAKAHFQQVKPMLDCFELHFGVYPFGDDSYKLVETPYWGMEHQSCVSYGNGYDNNRWGFDFIIVHESGHEWFGNSLSCNDPAEMWIHESFTTYSEAVYVECRSNYESAIRYLKEQRKYIENKMPMIGPYDVYYHGRNDNDIYYKGSWMLHSLRNAIDNDSLWFTLLRDINFKFNKSNVSTNQLIEFINVKTDRKWNGFFEQYLYQTQIPELEYKIIDKGGARLELRYRWSNTIKGFDMPIKMTVTKDKFEFVTPTRSWQIIDLNFFNPDDFKIQTDRSLITIKKL
jgi:aminopeptidase N